MALNPTPSNSFTVKTASQTSLLFTGSPDHVAGEADNTVDVLLATLSGNSFTGDYILNNYSPNGTVNYTVDLANLLKTTSAPLPQTSNEVHLLALTNGNTVVYYGNGDSGQTKFTFNAYFVVLNNKGQMIEGPTQINTFTDGPPNGSQTRVLSAAELDNGNIVFGYQRSDNGSLGTQVFTQAGAKVGTEQLIANGSGAFNIDVAASSGGGYLVAYSNSNLSDVSSYKTFSDSSTLLNTGTVFDDTSANKTANPLVVALANGDYLYVDGAGAFNGNPIPAKILSSTGAVISSVTLPAGSFGQAVALNGASDPAFVAPVESSTYNAALQPTMEKDQNGNTIFVYHNFSNVADNLAVDTYTATGTASGPTQIDTGTAKGVVNTSMSYYQIDTAPTYALSSGLNGGLIEVDNAPDQNDGSTSTVTVKLFDWPGSASPPPPAPTITSESSASSSGTSINAGKTVTFTVNFSESVTVSGTPTLTLNTGSTASYVSGSGTGALVFSYTVPSNANISDLQATAINLPNGATIQASGTNADLSGFQTIDTGVHIDTTAPSISSITLDKSAYGLNGTVTATIHLSGSSDGNGAYVLKAGSTIDGMTLTGSSYDSTHNTITASFTVGSGTTEVINGSVATNITVNDAAGNSSAAYTTAIGSTTIDTNAPTGLNVVGISNGLGHSVGEVSTVAGTTIGTMSTIDASSGDSFTYTLTPEEPGNTDFSKFTLSNNTLYVGSGGLNDGSVYNFNIVTTDLGGNSFTEPVTIIAQAPPPTVVSINRASGAANPTNSSTETFTVTFSAPVNGVQAGSFSLSGTDPTGTIGQPSSTDGGVTWTVPVTGVSGNGTLGLNLSSTSGIQASTGTPGNNLAGTHTSDQFYTIDTTPPTISFESVSPFGADLNAAKTVTFTIGTSEAVTATGSSLTLSNGATATLDTAHTTSTSLVYIYTVASGQDTGDLKATALNGTIKDGAGNALSNASFTTIDTTDKIDTTPPTIASESAASPGGDLAAGKTVTFTIGTSEAVTTTGSSLTLSNGGTATLDTADTTSTSLVYTYTVASGQDTGDLKATALNGSITDGAGNTLSNASFTTIDTGVRIDTVAPTISFESASPFGADLDAGKTVTFTIGTSEAVTATGSSLTLSNGGTATLDTADTTSTSLVYTYTVASGDTNTTDLKATALNGTITDGAGNALSNASFVTIDTTNTIDTVAPTIFFESASPFGGDLDAAKTVTFTIGTSEAVTATGSSLTLSNGATASLDTAQTTSTSLVYTYTVASGDTNTTDLKATALNGTITDGAGNALSNAGFVTIDTTNIIDTVAPTISSESASPTGGALDAGKTVTFTIGTSEAVTATGSSLTLSNGATAVLDTADTTSTSLVYTYTVASGDTNTTDLTATALNGTITDGAGNVLSNASFTTIDTKDVIDTIAPADPTLAVTSSTTSSGSSLLGLFNKTTTAFTGTAEAGSTVSIYDGKTLLGTTTATPQGTYSFTPPAPLPSGTNEISATATDAAGNTSGSSNTVPVLVGTTSVKTPGTPALSAASDTGSSAKDRITSDDTPTFTGKATGGTSVTLYDGNVAVGSAAIVNGTYSITTSALADGIHSLTAIAFDAMGDASKTSAAVSVTIDTTAPLAPTLTTTSAAGTTKPKLTGTAEAKSIVTISDNGQVLGTATATAKGTYTFTPSKALTGDNVLTATATDVAGNASTASAPLDVTIGGVNRSAASSVGHAAAFTQALFEGFFGTSGVDSSLLTAASTPAHPPLTASAASFGTHI